MSATDSLFQFLDRVDGIYVGYVIGLIIGFVIGAVVFR